MYWNQNEKRKMYFTYNLTISLMGKTYQFLEKKSELPFHSCFSTLSSFFDDCLTSLAPNLFDSDFFFWTEAWVMVSAGVALATVGLMGAGLDVVNFSALTTGTLIFLNFCLGSGLTTFTGFMYTTWSSLSIPSGLSLTLMGI